MSRILILEDDIEINHLLKRIFNLLGMEVVFAEGSMEALIEFQVHLFNEEPFDLILVDLIIPGEFGGLEFIEELQKFHTCVNIIVTSGYANHPVMLDPIKYRCCDKLEKPFSLDDLVKILQKNMILFPQTRYFELDMDYSNNQVNECAKFEKFCR